MSVLGVNLVGAEFSLPTSYYPSNSFIDYYRTRGLRLFRIPFKWERMQPGLMGPLDPTELAKLTACLDYIAYNKCRAVIVPHNQGRYTIGSSTCIIGSPQVPITAFADFWSKVAAAFKGKTAGIYGYDLMNEPHDMDSWAVWPAAAQAATDAIVAIDATVPVVIEGDYWASSYAWQAVNGNLHINHPENLVVYSAHSYWDHAQSGAYATSYAQDKGHPMMGVELLTPFVSWVKAHGHYGYVGEFGIPGYDPVNTPLWLPVMDNALKYLEANGIDGTFWAGGEWNKIGVGGPDCGQPMYITSCEPCGGVDSPQIAMLCADNHKG